MLSALGSVVERTVAQRILCDSFSKECPAGHDEPKCRGFATLSAPQQEQIDAFISACSRGDGHGMMEALDKFEKLQGGVNWEHLGIYPAACGKPRNRACATAQQEGGRV